MRPKGGRIAKPMASLEVQPSYAITGLASAGVGVLWTGVGVGVAAIQGTSRVFLAEWTHLQGFFLIALGSWLLLIIKSGALQTRIFNLTMGAKKDDDEQKGTGIQQVIVFAVGILGTASLIALGFPEHGIVLVFMWITCACVCFAAGAATVHTIEIIREVHGLLDRDIKASRYAPARTPELKGVVSYFTSFALLVTVGYAFAVLGTLDLHWTGPSWYIEAVRLFWPIIYVPTCTVAMIYPHVVVHRLIRREKEKTLQSCQQDMDELLGRFADLKKEDLDRTNSLAQLFERILATPDYVVDFGIAVRTLFPILLNVVSFFAKNAFTHGRVSP